MTPNDITVFIRDQSVGDERLRDLLETCVGRILRRDHLNVSRAEFARLTGPVPHVKDWLKASILSDAAWLRNVDHLGRAKKLMKLGSIAACVKEADKAMLLANEKLKGTVLGPDDEAVEFRFDDGFTFVRLLSEKALDLESSRMGHCIGNGAYDKDLRCPDSAFLSLRSPAGHPHATVEVKVAADVKGDLRSPSLDPELRATIVQASGKQNRQPLRRYVRYIVEFAEVYNLELEYPHLLGVARLDDGRFVSYEDLQEGMSVAGSLLLTEEHEIDLPGGIVVAGGVSFTNTRSSAPSGIRASTDISFVGCPSMRTLPPGLSAPSISVSGTLLDHVDTAAIDARRFSYVFDSPTACRVEVRPGSLTGLTVRHAESVVIGPEARLDSLRVYDVESVTVADDVVIVDEVELGRVYMHGFPAGVRAAKKMTLDGSLGIEFDGEMKFDHLTLRNGTFSIPPGLVAKNLAAYRCSIDRLPSNERYDILDLVECKVAELPRELRARYMRIEDVERFSRVAEIESTSILRLSACGLTTLPSIEASGLATINEPSATSFGRGSFVDGKLVLDSPSPELAFEEIRVTSPVFATLESRGKRDYQTEFPPIKLYSHRERPSRWKRPKRGFVPRWNTNTVVGACLVEGGTLLYESNAPVGAAVGRRNKRTNGSFETTHITKVRSGLIVGGDLVLASWSPIWKEVTNRGQWTSFTVEGNLVIRGYAATSRVESSEALGSMASLEQQEFESPSSPRIVVEGDLDCREAVALPPLEFFEVTGRILPPRRLRSFRIVLADLQVSIIQACEHYSEEFFERFSRREKPKSTTLDVIDRCRPPD